MKKILLALSGLLIASILCACAAKQPEKVEIPALDPAALITAEDVTSNAGFTPVVEQSETAREGNTATVFYRSEPMGAFDPVKVKVTQFTETIGYQTLYEQYEKDKSKRPSAELVPSLGQEAYIAFPSIHVYDRGCIIDITAGSGSDETQKNLLKNLAFIATGRLEEIIPDRTK